MAIGKRSLFGTVSGPLLAHIFQISLTITLILFVLISLRYRFPSHDEDIDADSLDVAQKEPEYHDIKHCLNKDFHPKYTDIVRCITRFNENVKFLNADKFVDHDEGLILAVIATNRSQYLSHVIKSLEKNIGIERATLIVSHDGYDKEVVEMVRNISFCRVKSVFHPFSRGYEGVKIRDDSDYTPVLAKRINSITSELFWKFNETTSSFLNDYRLRMSAPKNHYWWLWNFIFSRTNGDIEVAFIEEDHLLSHDYYQVTKRLMKIRPTLCPQCISSNSAFHPSPNQKISASLDAKKLKTCKFQNIGLSFNRTLFEWVTAQPKKFCEFDDYNWDLTIESYDRFRPTADFALSVLVPRAHHIGRCGLHFFQSCEPDINLQQYTSSIETQLPQDSSELDYEITTWLSRRRRGPARTRGVEGWTSGRIKENPRSRTSRILERWRSRINADHCYQVLSGFGIWSAMT